MRRRWLLLALPLLTLSLLPLQALAWNAAGHRLAAAVAWERLDGETRRAVTGLLRWHPDHARLFARAPDGDAGREAFLAAATWPDDIKGDRRFFDDGEAPTPPLPGFPDMARHRSWHYLDRPVGGTPARATSDGSLDRQLASLPRTLADPGGDPVRRAYALAWLIHLVADAHQPLHVVSRYDARGRGDEGGNRLTVYTPFHPRLASMSLHSYWDDLPGPPWLRGERLEREAQALIAATPAPPAGTARDWLDESQKLANEIAYPPGDDPVPTLSDAFNERALATARRRVAEAGYRLADLLRQLLAAPRR